MYLLGLNLVTMETFVDQKSRRAPPSVVYTTFQNASCFLETFETWRHDTIQSFHPAFTLKTFSKLQLLFISDSFFYILALSSYPFTTKPILLFPLQITLWLVRWKLISIDRTMLQVLFLQTTSCLMFGEINCTVL